MSLVTDIKVALLAKIDTTLEGLRDLNDPDDKPFFRLTNPQQVDRNNGLYYAKGYGVAYGPGANPQLENGCTTSWERIFSVILSKEYATTDHNFTLKDDLESQLMEEFIAVIKSLAADPTLGGICAKIDYVADSGIEQNRIDDRRYIELSFDLSVTYTESLT